MAELLLVVGFVLAIAFTVVNGFHDASNANALPVRFNALTPRVAVGMGAVFNLAGALTVGLVLTQLIPFDIPIPISTVGTVVIICTLITAIAWDMLTWWWAMPSSSTAAMSGGIIGSLVGAYAVGLAHDLAVNSYTIWRLALPIVVAPAIAFVLAQLLVFLAVYLVRHEAPGVVKSRSAIVQATGAAAIHFGHGIQHGRRAIWIFVVLLMCYGMVIPISHIPWWIPLLVGLCLGAGTLLGGWRIAYTLSSRVVNLDPLRAPCPNGRRHPLVRRWFPGPAAHVHVPDQHGSHPGCGFRPALPHRLPPHAGAGPAHLGRHGPGVRAGLEHVVPGGLAATAAEPLEHRHNTTTPPRPPAPAWGTSARSGVVVNQESGET